MFKYMFNNPLCLNILCSFKVSEKPNYDFYSKENDFKVLC